MVPLSFPSMLRSTMTDNLLTLLCLVDGDSTPLSVDIGTSKGPPLRQYAIKGHSCCEERRKIKIIIATVFACTLFNKALDKLTRVLAKDEDLGVKRCHSQRELHRDPSMRTL